MGNTPTPPAHTVLPAETPSTINEGRKLTLAKRTEFPDGRRFRLGGQVVQGSVVPLADGARFTVTDGSRSVVVVHHGTPPQLFQQGAAQGIGVVVEGAWAGGRFVSDTMLVKHDETYRPPAPGDATTQKAFRSGDSR